MLVRKGVGSNPTPINFKFFFAQEECFALHRPGQHSELAQRKRVGLITQRSQDRNLDSLTLSRLAQLVERKTLNLVVVGSSPTVGISFYKKLFLILFFFTNKKKFPNRDSNPGRVGENHIS